MPDTSTEMGAMRADVAVTLAQINSNRAAWHQAGTCRDVLMRRQPPQAVREDTRLEMNTAPQLAAH